MNEHIFGANSILKVHLIKYKTFYSYKNKPSTSGKCEEWNFYVCA